METLRALAHRFTELSTPLLADACLRRGVPLRVAPPGIRAVAARAQVSGRVLPARHYGSVDVFLEALEQAIPGDLLVIDNSGRQDEACVGDLIALEAQSAGVVGILIWGLHRDTTELIEIGLPIFSYGQHPAGPVRLDPRETEALQSARFGRQWVTSHDLAFADDDGVIFLAEAHAGEVMSTAAEIQQIERSQADRIQTGKSLRQQTAFDAYLKRRSEEPSYSFRGHLRTLGAAIEE